MCNPAVQTHALHTYTDGYTKPRYSRDTPAEHEVGPKISRLVKVTALSTPSIYTFRILPVLTNAFNTTMPVRCIMMVADRGSQVNTVERINLRGVATPAARIPGITSPKGVDVE